MVYLRYRSPSLPCLFWQKLIASIATKLSTIKSEIPRYQTLSAIRSSTPLNLNYFTMIRLCAYSSLQNLSIDIRFSDLRTKDKNVRKKKRKRIDTQLL